MNIEDKLIDLKIFHKRRKTFVNLTDEQKEAVKNFNERIQNSQIPMEEVKCLCKNDKFSLIGSVDRYGFIQSTVICTKCGLVQSNPRMTSAYYKYFYGSDEYRKLYGGNKFIYDYEKFYSEGRGDAIYQSIIEHKSLEDIKSVLEFGAAGGWNLVPFVKQGISVRGYDYSKELVKLGNKKGINLVHGSIEAIDGSYDVIIANHVIEHLTNFINDIKKLREHLNPAGIMFVGVPDIAKFSMAHLQNAHTYHFSLKTLQYYMEQCGLKMIHHQPETGGHLSAIFIKADHQEDASIIWNHYDEMSKMLRRYNRAYYPRYLLVKCLELLRLKNSTKRILNYFNK